jgi:hypothetical protein
MPRIVNIARLQALHTQRHEFDLTLHIISHLRSAKSYILGLGPSVLARRVRYNFVVVRLSSRRRIDGNGNSTICAKTYLIARRESRQVRLSVLRNWAVSAVSPPLDEMCNGARGRTDAEDYTSHAGAGLGLQRGKLQPFKTNATNYSAGFASRPSLELGAVAHRCLSACEADPEPKFGKKKTGKPF